MEEPSNGGCLLPAHHCGNPFTDDLVHWVVALVKCEIMLNHQISFNINDFTVCTALSICVQD